MRLALALAALAAAAPLVAAPLTAQSSDPIDRAVAAWSKVKTVKGTFEQTVSNSLTGTSATAHGDYVQERPNRLAIRFRPPESGAIVSDGKILWIYLPSSTPGQVVKRMATDGSAVPIDFTGQFLDAPRTRYDITPIGTRTVEGHAAHGFKVVPKAGTSSAFTAGSVWVDDDDALIREFEGTESTGVTRHIRITSLEPNASVDRSSFTFTPPTPRRTVPSPRRRSAITRSRVLEAALDLFRRQGFEATTMRDIASAAGISLGASYYYFPHKEAIVEAYYESVQSEHRARLAGVPSARADLRARLGIVMHTKLDIIERDRWLLGGLFRFVGEPGHRLSPFGAGTAQHRRQAIGVFEDAVRDSRPALPPDLESVLPGALWLLHMGLILYFIHDDSPNHQRTRALTDAALDLVSQLVRISSHPLLRRVLRPSRALAVKLLRDAGLLTTRVPRTV
jgi:chaperone LolA